MVYPKNAIYNHKEGQIIGHFTVEAIRGIKFYSEIYSGVEPIP